MLPTLGNSGAFKDSLADNKGSREEQGGSPMLDRYLADPPTISEKILLSKLLEQTAKIVEGKVTPTKEPVGECQAMRKNKR